MKILHTSDWHLGKTLENISRIDEQKEFINELCDIAEREDIDLVLIAGDIFDTYNPSSAAEELFYEALDRLNERGKRAVIVIAGNHDSPDRLCAASPLAYRNGIILLGYPASDAGLSGKGGENISITASGQGWLEIRHEACGQNAVIIALPYPSESRLEQVLSRESDEERLQRAYSEKVGEILSELSGNFREDTVNLVVSHIFLRDGKSSDSERQLGSALLVDPEVLPREAHYVALGHLHRPQRVKGSPAPAYYSGSPLAYSFSETDYSKAVYIVDAEPGRAADIKEIYLSSGRPLRQWKARNGIEEALGWCEEGRDSNAWIDLEIHTDRIITMEEQKRLRELNPGIINIRPVVRTQAEVQQEAASREGKRMDELFLEYVRYKSNGMEASKELLDTFLEIINDMDEDEAALTGGESLEAEVS